MTAYTACFVRDVSSEGSFSAPLTSEALPTAKAEAAALLAASFKRSARVILSTWSAGLVVSRSEFNLGGTGWKPLKVPVETAERMGYRVLGKYSTEHPGETADGRHTDVCDRCGSGIQRAVIVARLSGPNLHVGVDCAARLRLAV